MFWLLIFKVNLLLFFIQHKRIVIKGGTVVNHDHMFEADVFIEDGFIK